MPGVSPARDLYKYVDEVGILSPKSAEGAGIFRYQNPRILGRGTSKIRIKKRYQQMSQVTTAKKEVLARECRFSVHVPKKSPEDDDWHMVKEVVHYSDGTSEPRIRLIKNFERPMWVTKPAFRNHKEKKEFEHMERLMRKSVTQSDLRSAVAKAVGMEWSRGGIRELSASPYLYGTDISSTCIIKQTQYRAKWPNTVSAYSVCTFDTETSMFDQDGTIIMSSAAYKDKVVFCVRKDIVDKFTDPKARFETACRKYLEPYFNVAPDKPLPFSVEWIVGDDEVDTVRKVFNRIHEWKPDFVAIWNIDFDITKVLEACKRANINPEDILSDPSVPPQIRRCHYKRGLQRKVTAAGKSQPINPASQWHSLFLTASFYVIDAMCVYRLLRLSKQELAEYNLDFVLKANGLKGKLKFTEADAYEKDAWHTFMQANFIFEYMVYNIIDSYAMLLLDQKTKDLSNTLPDFAASTDFWDFNSQPKRLRDAMFWYGLAKHNRVIGTVAPKPKDKVTSVPISYSEEGEDFSDEDEESVDNEEMTVLSRKGWVLTLPAHLNVLGLPLLKNQPRWKTLFRAFTYDSDAVSAYPSAAIISNYSKATTKKELTGVRGIPESVFRLQNLNMILGPVNSNDYCRSMMNMPRQKELLKQFMSRH